jgi:hypothetical protein
MISSTEPLSQPPSRGAARMARHRRRRKKGFRCLMVELHEAEIEALIKRQQLGPENRNDPGAVKAALYKFLEDTLRA